MIESIKSIVATLWVLSLLVIVYSFGVYLSFYLGLSTTRLPVFGSENIAISFIAAFLLLPLNVLWGLFVFKLTWKRSLYWANLFSIASFISLTLVPEKIAPLIECSVVLFIICFTTEKYLKK